jgi:hypothetical protein
MHLERGLTTTSTKKRKIKITKAQQEEFERGWRDRNVRLREMHLPKETFEQYLEWVYGKGRKTKTKEKYVPKRAQATSAYGNVIDAINSRNSVATEITNSNEKKENGKKAIHISSKSDWVTGACSTKPTPTYTGSNVLGIAVMHKSCLQPVFSQEAAEDSAKMRR